MKYSVPLKKLTSLLNEEIQNSFIGPILEIPLNSHDNEFFLFIYKQLYFQSFQKHINNWNSMNDTSFSYDDIPENNKNLNNVFFDKIKDCILSIQNNKLSDAKARDFINTFPSLFLHLDSYSHKKAVDFFTHFKNPSDVLYFPIVFNNMFIDKDINVDLGDENGMPNKSIMSTQDYISLASILIRPNLPASIIINSESPEIVIKALLPNSKIDETNVFFQQDFSFKNELFVNTINETFLDETFLQVATMESILVNIDSYIEDIDFLAKKYGYLAYIQALQQNRIIEMPHILTQDDNSDFNKLVKDFYHFISQIPQEFTEDPENLNTITLKLSKKLNSLDNNSVIPSSRQLLIRYEKSKLYLFDQKRISVIPFSINQLLEYMPNKENLNKLRDYDSQRITNLFKFILNSENNVIEYFNNQKFSVQDINNFLNGTDRDKWIYVITTLPNMFPKEVYNDITVRQNLIDALKFSIDKSLSKNYLKQKSEYSSSLEYTHFLNTLTTQEIDELLTYSLDKASIAKIEINGIHVTANGPQFSILKLTQQSKEISIIDSLLRCKMNNLAADFINKLNECQNEPNNSELTTQCITIFENLSKFILDTQADYLILSPIQNLLDKTGGKVFFDFQEFFLFNIYNDKIYENTSNLLNKSLFERQTAGRSSSLNMQKTPEFYLSYILDLKTRSPQLASLYFSFINIDSLTEQKSDFFKPEWLNVFKHENLNGYPQVFIQNLITSAAGNIDKLKECQNIISAIEQRGNRLNYFEFKVTNKVIQQIQNYPDLAKHLPYFISTCSNLFEKISPNIKYNSDFWISLINEVDSLPYSSPKLLSPLKYIEEVLLEDKRLILSLLKTYNGDDHFFNKFTSSFNKKYEMNAIELFQKPEHLLKLAQKYSNGEISTQTLKKLQPQLFTFAQSNNIEKRDLYHKINIIVEQTFLDSHISINVDSPKNNNKNKF